MNTQGKSTGNRDLARDQGRASGARESKGSEPETYGGTEQRLQDADLADLGEAVEDSLRNRRNNGVPDAPQANPRR